MNLHMLDTNMVSHLLRGHPRAGQRLKALPMASLCISAITHGELMFGLAKRPEARRLHVALREFLRRVDILDWDRAAAECYGSLRASMAGKGVVIAPLDLPIAAHAMSAGAVLATNDRAFGRVPGLTIEDWCAETGPA